MRVRLRVRATAELAQRLRRVLLLAVHLVRVIG